MKVILEPVSGTPKANLERAKVETQRVVGFRGTVKDTKVEGDHIVVTIEINSKWDLPEAQRVLQLKEWMAAKTRLMFKVESIL